MVVHEALDISRLRGNLLPAHRPTAVAAMVHILSKDVSQQPTPTATIGDWLVGRTLVGPLRIGLQAQGQLIPRGRGRLALLWIRLRVGHHLTAQLRMTRQHSVVPHQMLTRRWRGPCR